MTTLEPSLLQAEHTQLLQPFIIGEVLQSSEHLCSSHSRPALEIHICLALRALDVEFIICRMANIYGIGWQ